MQVGAQRNSNRTVNDGLPTCTETWLQTVSHSKSPLRGFGAPPVTLAATIGRYSPPNTSRGAGIDCFMALLSVT